MGVTVLQKKIRAQSLSHGSAPTSADLLNAARRNAPIELDHIAVLTAKLSRTPNNELHILIDDDCPYVTFPDHVDRPQAKQWGIKSRHELNSRTPDSGLEGLSRVSAGVILRADFNDVSGTIGLERGKFSPDSPKSMTTNQGKISYMNGGMNTEGKGPLVPSRLANDELNSELAMIQTAGNIGYNFATSCYLGSIHAVDEKYATLHGAGFIDQIPQMKMVLPLDVDHGPHGTQVIRTFLRGHQVDITRAFAHYDYSIGSVELAHRYRMQMQGTRGEYHLVSNEPVGGVVHVITDHESIKGRLTKHFYGALTGDHGDLAKLPVQSRSLRAIGFDASGQF
jgi:hypothetical protein